VDVWESEEDGQSQFDRNIKPNLPPGIVPNQTTYYPVTPRSR
jgi:hypothetical protein